MRLPRVRLTVRTMMIIVAAVASGLAYVAHRRSEAFRQIASANAQMAEIHAAKVKTLSKVWRSSDDGARLARQFVARHRMTEEQAEQSEKLADEFKRGLDVHEKWVAYYKGLDEKYRRAATWPWLPFAPDPPPPVAGRPTGPPALTRPEDAPIPPALGISLPKEVFELGEHPIFGGNIPLTTEFRNRSEKPVTIYPIGLVVVTDERGRETELTSQGRLYREWASPGETRRKHSSIVLGAGESHRDVGLDLTRLFRLRPGKYTVEVIYNDPPMKSISPPVNFEVKRAKPSG
jgi:hypothetical protein